MKRSGFDDETLQVSMNLAARASADGDEVMPAGPGGDVVAVPVQIEIAMTPELQALLTGRSAGVRRADKG